MTMRCLRVVGLLLTAMLVTGCGGKHGAKVYGNVTLDGEPLPADSVGTVAFFPSAGGPPATGVINDDSSYRLTTGRDRSLPPGDYNVTVGVNQAPDLEAHKGPGPPPPGKPITPVKYRQSRTSGLSYTVERGSQTIDLELTSTP